MKLLPSWMRLRFGRAEKRMCWLLLGLIIVSIPILLLFDYNIFTWYVCIAVLGIYTWLVYQDNKKKGYDPLLLTIPPK
jgi:hypothetical protein